MKQRIYTYDMISDKMKSKLLSLYDVDLTTQCWNWTGRSGHLGYGFMSGVNKSFTNLVVHRLSWMLHNQQDWPLGLETRHMCHNRKCINPDHLVPGTKAENGDDRKNRYGPKLSKLQKTRLKYWWITPKGQFASKGEASANHGLSPPGLQHRMNVDSNNYYKIKR